MAEVFLAETCNKMDWLRIFAKNYRFLNIAGEKTSRARHEIVGLYL